MKKTSVLVAGALAAGSIVAFSGGSAEAASSPLDYVCSSLLGPTTMRVVDDTDLPAQVPVGATVPMHLTSAVALPSTALSLISALYPTATGVVGDVTSTGTMTGPAGVGSVPVTTELPVPLTSLSQLDSAGNLPLHLTGEAQDFTAPVPGLYTIKAGGFTSALSAQGPLGVLGAIPAMTCVAPDVDTTIDTVKAVVPSTATLRLARSTEGYGQATIATATVASSDPLAAALGAPAGSVRFTVGRRSVTAALDGNGVARAKLPRLAAGHSYSVVAHYAPAASSFYQAAKSSPKSLKVVRAGTRTAVVARNIRRRHAEVATIAVTSTYKATVTGKVRATLKRGTRSLRSRTVSLERGRATVRFGRLAKRGRYSVVAHYLGSADFVRSGGRRGFSVR
ncbi:MAG TPA: hypothetical protein VI452_10455 [Marmoricola sp.]